MTLINKLEKNQIFVFGSNLGGQHMGGAAKQAREMFGAIEGVGEGLTGCSYAFPTLRADFSKRDDEELRLSVKRLYSSCEFMDRLTFLLTSVGTGIAGYSVEYMKSLFVNPPSNLILPEEWKDVDVKEKDCEICGGQGFYFEPAKVEGGVLIDDKEVKCACSIKEVDEYDNQHDS